MDFHPRSMTEYRKQEFIPESQDTVMVDNVDDQLQLDPAQFLGSHGNSVQPMDLDIDGQKGGYLLNMPSEIFLCITQFIYSGLKLRDLASWSRTCTTAFHFSDRFLATEQLLACHLLKEFHIPELGMNRGNNEQQQDVQTPRQRTSPYDNPNKGYTSPFRPITYYGDSIRTLHAQHTEIVRSTIARGAKVTEVDSRGANALFYASRLLNVEAVKILLAAGSEVNLPFPKHMNEFEMSSPLLAAVEHGSLELVEVLLNAGADPEHSSCAHQCRTPLRTALYYNDIPMARLLIVEGGANVNRQSLTKGGVIGSPLLQCISADAIKLLCETGANVNLRSKLGDTPLWYLKRKSNFERPRKRAMVQVLRQYGAVEVKPRSGHTHSGYVNHAADSDSVEPTQGVAHQYSYAPALLNLLENN